ncbi:hypothetical protein NM208_g254 [Fusarium decemcellulare]|uniref:Uncharacterized protein n=1 Tax=Fusarium decemcellulare TaxID=57161 RepID=A0ACC1T0F0_9HYPO|nr:hypothetical protein NM208_g254 [Fusarium decemcellulare]
MEAGKPEYQHFIPQFLLKNFSHPFKCPLAKGKPAKCKKHRHEKHKFHNDPVVNSLCLSGDDFQIKEPSVRRMYGLDDMYTDWTKPSELQRQLEIKFSELENAASRILRKITGHLESGRSETKLTRTNKDLLRKFLFLLTHRAADFYQRYNFESIEDYHHEDQTTLKEFMEKHALRRPIDVWLHSLHAIIDLKMDAGRKWEESIMNTVYLPVALMFMDQIGGYYMALCTPANENQELILADYSYNVSEGPVNHFWNQKTGKNVCLGPSFHYFAPISPTLAIILRSNILPHPAEDRDPMIKAQREALRLIESRFGHSDKSILEDLPVHRAFNNYSRVIDGRQTPNPGWDECYRDGDWFSFPFFQLSTRHVQIINGLLIDHAFHGSTITFNRKDLFLDLLEWFLTEPCEVGKNVMGEHSDQQKKYIEKLARFMLAEGRAVVANVTFWPTRRDLDVEGFLKGFSNAVRFIEDSTNNHGSSSNDESRDETQQRPGGKTFQDVEKTPDQKPEEKLCGDPEAKPTQEPGCDHVPESHHQQQKFKFDRIYEANGGNLETLANDIKASLEMLDAWVKYKMLDEADETRKSARLTRLDVVLRLYQERLPSARFWMFLKQLRCGMPKPDQGMQSPDYPPFLDNESWTGPEDHFSHMSYLLEPCDVNIAMWGAFVRDTGMSREVGQRLGRAELASLLDDDEEPEQSKGATGSHPSDMDKAPATVQNGKPEELGMRDDLPAKLDMRYHIGVIPSSNLGFGKTRPLLNLIAKRDNMKLHHIIVLLGAVVHVQACIRVHARHFQAPWPEKDGISIELWDNDHTYYRCPGCSWESYAGQSCTVQCHQFKIKLNPYGRGGHVTNNNNGYSHSLSIKTSGTPSNWCCLFGNGGNCRGNCQVWDYCLTDKYSNCNKYACRLCGGKAICGIRDKRSLGGLGSADGFSDAGIELDIDGVFEN